MKKQALLFLAGLLGLCAPVRAQQGMILYNLADLPQRNQLNPALPWFGEATVAPPLVSSPHVSMSNAFSYSDFIRRSADDSLYMDPEHMIGRLHADNMLQAVAETGLFGFGLRLGKHQFGFEVTEKAYLYMRYSREFMDFLWKGNAATIGERAELGLGMNFTHRRDYALTYAYEVNDRFRAGARLKYLYGMENITVHAARATLLTDPNTLALTATTNIQINTAGIESNTFDDFNADEYLFGRHNTGWGMDLGVQALLGEGLTVSAGVIDLGQIRWRSHTENYIGRNTDNEFTYDGIDLNVFLTDTSGASQVFDDLMDTLGNAFDVRKKQADYSAGLPVQSYLGLGYARDDRNSFYLLVHSLRFDGRTRFDLALSYCLRMGRWFTVSPGVSHVNASWQAGMGVVLSLGTLQVYCVSDNVYGMLRPLQARNVDARAGINYVIGRKY